MPLFLRDSAEDAAAGDAEGRRPEDSVYFHPQLNPYGAPPPGRPQKWKTVGTAGARLALVRACGFARAFVVCFCADVFVVWYV